MGISIRNHESPSQSAEGVPLALRKESQDRLKADPSGPKDNTGTLKSTGLENTWED